MNAPRRVAVTGVGVISALGLDTAAFWTGLTAGRSGIRPLTLIPAESVRFTQGAEVPDYDPARHFDERSIMLLDRFAQFAVLAAREAVAQSGLTLTPELQARAAVVTGTCVGGQTTEDAEFLNLYQLNRTRFPPLTIPRIMANAGASQIALEFGLQGPAYTVSTACASAGHALGQAFWLVRNGVANCALAGGSEAPFSLGILKAWEAMRVVSPDTCRPFSLDRKGLILGEGAAMLVLEPLESAISRGATVLAEIAGFGMSSDAHHVTQPAAAGAVRAMRMALEDGGLAPEQIGYVNAHGTGTLANDVTETQALRDLFGGHARQLAVSSTKSMHGHTLGAAGAMEAAATVLALHHGILPPTANYTTPDPACDLDIIPNTARQEQVEAALSSSFAFGGLNAVLAIRRAGGTTQLG